MKSFLIVYDRRAGELREFRVFDAHESAEALQERFRQELNYGSDSGIEVVVLRATSEDAIKETHNRYFASGQELLHSVERAVQSQPGEPSKPDEVELASS